MTRRALIPLSSRAERASPVAALKARLDEKKALETQKRERERELYEEYLNAADAVWILENIRKKEAPKAPDFKLTERFILSLKWLAELKDYRDRLYDEVNQ